MTKPLARRYVEPEILDGLSAGDPRAIASRRDLVRINILMFQVGIMATLLVKHVSAPPSRLLEIGAGDGTFMLAVARRLAKKWPGVHLVLLDRADIVPLERHQDFKKLGWQLETVTADIFEWLRRNRELRFDAVTSNLFLHHFQDSPLAHLLSEVQPLAPLFLATEPRRGAFPLIATRLLRAIGANAVTRHDAAASVRAGFSGAELSALWPGKAGRPLEERQAGLFTHAFAASAECRP